MKPVVNHRSAVSAAQKTEETELLTVREVAAHLRVDDTTVRRWIQSGALEAVTLPHKSRRKAYRVRKAVIDAMLQPKEVRRG